MSTRVMLARHGETEWNVAEIFRGRTEISLNETGTKQAELLAEYLNDYKLEAIYASPLRRALETARKIAAPHQLEVEVDHGLTDFDYGKWTGLSHPEVKERHPELYTTWKTHPEKVKMPDGESLDDVNKRAMEVVNRIIARHQGRVLLVTHRVIIKVLICAMLGLGSPGFWNIRMDTGAITTFLHEQERFILEEHNNTCSRKLYAEARLADF